MANLRNETYPCCSHTPVNIGCDQIMFIRHWLTGNRTRMAESQGEKNGAQNWSIWARIWSPGFFLGLVITLLGHILRVTGLDLRHLCIYQIQSFIIIHFRRRQSHTFIKTMSCKERFLLVGDRTHLIVAMHLWSCWHPKIARSSPMSGHQNVASLVSEKNQCSARKIERVCYLQNRQSYLFRISSSVYPILAIAVYGNLYKKLKKLIPKGRFISLPKFPLLYWAESYKIWP